jgi:hypothetical protein
MSSANCSAVSLPNPAVITSSPPQSNVEPARRSNLWLLSVPYMTEGFRLLDVGPHATNLEHSDHVRRWKRQSGLVTTKPVASRCSVDGRTSSAAQSREAYPKKATTIHPGTKPAAIQ